MAGFVQFQKLSEISVVLHWVYKLNESCSFARRPPEGRGFHPDISCPLLDIDQKISISASQGPEMFYY